MASTKCAAATFGLFSIQAWYDWYEICSRN